MDVTGAAFYRLCREPTILSAVDTWLYRHKLPVIIEGSGRAAAVLSQAGGWRQASLHNTARFPKLRVEIFQDSSPNKLNAESRAYDTWVPFDRILHQPRGLAEIWGDVRVIGSVRQSEPDIFPVTDGESAALLVADYALTIA